MRQHRNPNARHAPSGSSPPVPPVTNTSRGHSVNITPGGYRAPRRFTNRSRQRTSNQGSPRRHGSPIGGDRHHPRTQSSQQTRRRSKSPVQIKAIGRLYEKVAMYGVLLDSLLVSHVTSATSLLENATATYNGPIDAHICPVPSCIHISDGSVMHTSHLLLQHPNWARKESRRASIESTEMHAFRQAISDAQQHLATLKREYRAAQLADEAQRYRALLDHARAPSGHVLLTHPLQGLRTTGQQPPSTPHQSQRSSSVASR